MKISRNKVILIVLIVIMLGGTIIYKVVSNKSEENVKENKKCDKRSSESFKNLGDLLLYEKKTLKIGSYCI